MIVLFTKILYINCLTFYLTIKHILYSPLEYNGTKPDIHVIGKLWFYRLFKTCCFIVWRKSFEKITTSPIKLNEWDFTFYHIWSKKSVFCCLHFFSDYFSFILKKKKLCVFIWICVHSRFLLLLFFTTPFSGMLKSCPFNNFFTSCLHILLWFPIFQKG